MPFSDARDLALDARSTPVMVCDAQCRLLHANSAAVREFEAGQSLWEHEGRLLDADSAIERRFLAALSCGEDASDEPRGLVDRRVDLFNAHGAAAELVIRPALVGGIGRCWVFQPALHRTTTHPADFDSLSDRLGLTRRQRDLAELLLRGSSLSQAGRATWALPAAPRTSY